MSPKAEKTYWISKYYNEYEQRMLLISVIHDVFGIGNYRRNHKYETIATPHHT